MDGVTPGDLVLAIFQASNDMDTAQNSLEEALNREVRSLEALVKAKAAAYRTVQGRNREEREAYVDDDCVEQIVDNKQAANDVKGLMQKVLGKRQSLSSYQTASKSLSEESQHSRVGPDLTGMDAPRPSPVRPDLTGVARPQFGQS